MALKLGDTTRALNSINTISRSAPSFPYIPRSRILELAARLDPSTPPPNDANQAPPLSPDALVKRITTMNTAVQNSVC